MVTHWVKLLFGNGSIAAVWHLYIVRKGRSRRRPTQKRNTALDVFHFVRSEGTGHLSSRRSLLLLHIFYVNSIFKSFPTQQSSLTRPILLAHSRDLLTNRIHSPQHLSTLSRVFDKTKTRRESRKIRESVKVCHKLPLDLRILSPACAQ